MSVELFIKGAIIGFSIAAPVGPIGLLCIKRTLSAGRLTGFLCGMGAAVADAIYGLIAGVGMGALAAFLANSGWWLQLVGGIMLICLGWRTFTAPPATDPAKVDGKGLLESFVSTFFLTLSNPMTILSFAGVFASLAKSADTSISSPVVVLGIFVGSALWWLILSTAAGAVRHRLSDPAMCSINRCCGLVLVAFGLAALI